MTDASVLPVDRILVRGLRLWTHVGVLAFERAEGQWFELDLELAVDLAPAGRHDDLASTLDYSRVITALQRQARTLRCLTLEHYAEQILDICDGCAAEQRGKQVPVRLELRKCKAPVPGFTGGVAVRRSRHWPASAG